MAPLRHLARRAQKTTNFWLGVVIVVALTLAALFTVVVICIICWRKRARRQRQRKFNAEQETRSLVAREAGTTQTYSLVAQPYNAHGGRVTDSGSPDMDTGSVSPIELQGGIFEEMSTTPQQLDGFVAPATATYNGQPVEMPAPATGR